MALSEATHQNMPHRCLLNSNSDWLFLVILGYLGQKNVYLFQGLRKCIANESGRKICDNCGQPIWIQYRKETNDFIPLDFGNGGPMKPHDCGRA